MSEQTGRILQKASAIAIAILMLGILGMFVGVSGADSGGSGEDDSNNGSRATNIGDNLQLWDTYDNQPHDGVFGDGDLGDSYEFYLNSNYVYLSFYLKNIMTEGYYTSVTTTMKTTTLSENLISFTDATDYDSQISYGSVEYFSCQFNIGSSGYITNYELSLKVDFTVVIGSTTTDKSGTINLWIKLKSRIETADSGSILKLQATDRFDNIVPLYSGAKSQLLSLPNIFSGSGNIENVEFTLSLPSGFELDSKVAEVETIDTSYYYSDDPLWLLREAGTNDKSASIKSGTLKVMYTHYGTSVTERDVPIKIEIAMTPLLTLDGQIDESDIGSTTGGLYESNVQINQGTSTKTFSLLFKNDGNVDLKDVDVELYTDDAAYFFKSNFYYDEGDHASKRSFGNVVKLGNLYKGQIVKKEFSTDMIKNLPPGLYRIPIKYSAQYNTGGLIDVDLDDDDYHEEIIEARSQYNEGYDPFLLVDVKEGENYQDYNEPDLLAVSNTILRPGMRNVQLTVELANLENYKITNVNPMIESGSGSPIKALNSINDTVMKINSIETDFIIYGANDPTFSNKYTVHYYIDVDPEAEPGLHDLPIIVTCYDTYNQVRVTTVYVSIKINPIPPRFIISNAQTDEINPNDNFTLTVDVFNSGGSDAMNVKLMFNGSSNLFSSKYSVQGPKFIPKNDDTQFIFKVSTGEVEPGQTYVCSLYACYEDEMGNFNNYDPNCKLTLPLHIQNKDPLFAPSFIITDTLTSDIKSGEEFTLKVKVMNCGGSDAKNVRLMFNGSTNLFSANENIQTTTILRKSQETDFEFRIKAGDVHPGTTYTSSIYVSHEDSDGKYYGFYANPEHYIALRSKAKEQDALAINEGFALVILALFILIGAIIVGMARSRASRHGRTGTEGAMNGRVPAPKAAAPKAGKFGGWGKKKSNIIEMTDTTYQAPAQSQVPLAPQTAQPTYAQAPYPQAQAPIDTMPQVGAGTVPEAGQPYYPPQEPQQQYY